MERLWAPWRSDYVMGYAKEPSHSAGGEDDRDQAPACVFCTYLGRGPAHFAEGLILCARPEAFVIMNRYPYNNGHIMVVPTAHVPSPEDLAPAVHDAFYRLVTDALPALRAALAPHGVNMGMNFGRVAGAGITDHCHMHLVPRWNGDTSFMPTLADTRVISQHIQTTYEVLHPHFAPLGA